MKIWRRINFLTEETIRYESLQKLVEIYKEDFLFKERLLLLFEQAWQMSGYEHFIYNLYRIPVGWKLLDKLLNSALPSVRNMLNWE